jgi:hypothetical protein
MRKSRMVVIAVGGLGLVLLTGCSGVTFKKAESGDTNGIRYYRPATYLLIKPDYEKQEASLEWVALADTRTPYVAKPYAFMATNTTELSFANGLLTKVTAETNSTAVPKAAIAALNELVKSALETASKAAVAAGGFTVSGKRSDPKISPSPENSIFLFKVEVGDGGKSVVKRLYPPEPPVPPSPSR